MSIELIAALFVQSEGCYSEIDYIDMWDEDRDARKYDRMLPVIAHPPCQLWGAFAFVNHKRWGGDHNLPGNDGGCFRSALKSVRRCGGVLEHPAASRAFKTHGLATPRGMGWQATLCGGWVCEVWQSAYGHPCNKATWLYYNGNKPPPSMIWDRIEGDYQIGGHDQRGKEANKPTIAGKRASATPILFRDSLIEMTLGLQPNDKELSQ